MDNDISILVTICFDKSLWYYAIKASRDLLSYDEIKYWAMPTAIRNIRKLLPPDAIGEIVRVEEICDVVVVKTMEISLQALSQPPGGISPQNKSTPHRQRRWDS